MQARVGIEYSDSQKGYFRKKYAKAEQGGEMLGSLIG